MENEQKPSEQAMREILADEYKKSGWDGISDEILKGSNGRIIHAELNAMRRVAAPEPAQQTDRNAVLEEALSESIKLQSHYAKLLNGYDGGIRKTFRSSEDWIERLHELKSTPPQQPEDK